MSVKNRAARNGDQEKEHSPQYPILFHFVEGVGDACACWLMY
jgi:hypothetical protein